jgi:hypothetical protein
MDAVSKRSLEFIELLVNHGADLSSVPFSHVWLSWDPTINRFFLERGTDFITGAPFTEAFTAKIRTALRPFMECKRNHPGLSICTLMRTRKDALWSGSREFCSQVFSSWTTARKTGESTD